MNKELLILITISKKSMTQIFKQFFPIILSIIFVGLFSNTCDAAVALKENYKKAEITTKNINKNFSRTSLEKKLGRKLNLKERILLRISKRKFKRQQKRANEKLQMQSKRRKGGKSQVIALILAITLGLFGVHRFYLGYTGMGVLYIFTFGLIGIGWLIDIILLIIPNGLTPKGEKNYRD